MDSRDIILKLLELQVDTSLSDNQREVILLAIGVILPRSSIQSQEDDNFFFFRVVSELENRLGSECLCVLYVLLKRTGCYFVAEKLEKELKEAADSEHRVEKCEAVVCEKYPKLVVLLTLGNMVTSMSDQDYERFRNTIIANELHHYYPDQIPSRCSLIEIIVLYENNHELYDNDLRVVLKWLDQSKCSQYKKHIFDHYKRQNVSLASLAEIDKRQLQLIKEDAVRKVLLKEMEQGYILLNNVKMVICGPPFVGKTAFKCLLLNKPAPLKHNSTQIAARPIQAIERIAAGKNIWKEVNEDDLLQMLSDTICDIKNQPTPIQNDSYVLVDAPCSSQEVNVTIVEPFTEDVPVLFPLSLTAQVPSHVVADTTRKPASFDDVSHKIVKLASEEKRGSQRLHEVSWIHLLDSGGQPQFTDLLRMFIRNNSLYIIVMKVTESLDEKPTFVYSVNGQPVSTPKEMTSTNLQIIVNFVRSVAMAVRDKVGDETIISKPAFSIIATHNDKLSIWKSKETYRRNNEILQECLSEFLDLFIFYNRDSNELIFPVDNLCQWNRTKISADIRSRLVSSHSDHIFNVKIPLRWYVFDLNMKKEALKETHGIILLESCYAIGTKLDMNESEVLHCLNYLDSMRLCIYYPNIIPRVVFTSPQFLIDCLSNIVRVSFVDDLRRILPPGVSLSDETVLSLKRDGVFDESLLDNLGLTFLPNLFSKSDLLSLLQHFRLISPIEAAHDVHQYFIPVILPAERLTEEQKAIFGSTLDPLIISFKGQLVLQGLFPALIVSLLSRQREPLFYIDSFSSDFPKQLRHAVKLYSEDLFGSVFLCEDYKWIEVYFTGPHQHCCLLRKVILEGLSASAGVLGYDEEALDICALVRCNRKHIKAVNDNVPHPITLSKKINPPAIGCSMESGLPTVSMSDIDERQSFWLVGSTVSVIESNALPANGTAVLDQSHAPIILEAIKTVVFEWEKLGLNLGIAKYKLDEIKYNCRDQVQVCRKDMVYYWIETKNATCDRLMIALKKVGEVKLADDIKKLQNV